MYAIIANSKKFGKMIVEWDPYYTPYSMAIRKVAKDTPYPLYDLFFHEEELDSIKFLDDNEVHYNIINKNLSGVTNDTHCIGCEFTLLETNERYYVDFVNKTIRNLTEEEEKKAKEKELEEELKKDTDEKLEEAKRLINEFTIAEYEQESDFSDLHNVGLAYTTLTDFELEVQVTADLVDFKITYEFDREVYNTEHYDSIEGMLKSLECLDFSELVYVPDEIVERHLDNICESDNSMTKEEKVVRIGKINYASSDNDFTIYDDGITTLVIDWVNHKYYQVDQSYFIPWSEDEEFDEAILEEKFFKESSMTTYDYRQKVTGGYYFVTVKKDVPTHEKR